MCFSPQYFGWCVSSEKLNLQQSLLSAMQKTMQKLIALHSVLSHRHHISSLTCSWWLDFLTSRPQHVQLDNHCSSTIGINTGVPQGCVLSPLLYSLLTHDCRPVDGFKTMKMFADDTTVIGLIRQQWGWLQRGGGLSGRMVWNQQPAAQQQRRPKRSWGTSGRMLTHIYSSTSKWLKSHSAPLPATEDI